MGRNSTAKVLEADPWKEWEKHLRARTQKELALYDRGDWLETMKYLLGGCPDKIETAILMICLELRIDPTNENLTTARRYLTWALGDLAKAQAIVKTRL